MDPDADPTSEDKNPISGEDDFPFKDIPDTSDVSTDDVTNAFGL